MTRYFDAAPYDNLGRLRSRELPDPDGAGPLTAVTTYTYDVEGRVRTVTDPRGQVTTYSATPWRIASTRLTDRITAVGATQRAYLGLGWEAVCGCQS